MEFEKAVRLFALTALAASVVACDGADGAVGPVGKVGAPGDQGDRGEKGEVSEPMPGDISVSGVTPSTVYLERAVDVVISGFGTEFTAPTVDFGAGITVDSTTVASGTGILATITVSDAAALGVRDVLVSEGGVDYNYTGAFTVAAPLAFTELDGVARQGGRYVSAVEMLDKNTPFDLTLDGQLTDAAIPGVLVTFDDLTSFGAVTTSFIDINATPGVTDFVIDSALDGFASTSRAVNAFEVTATAPIVISPDGTPAYIAMPGGDLATVVAEVTFGANMLGQIDLRAYTVNANVFPDYQLISATGAWQDRLATTEPYTGQNLDMFVTQFIADNLGAPTEVGSGPAGDRYYLVVTDIAGAGGYDVEVIINEVVSQEVEPNDACATAQDLGDLDGVAEIRSNLSFRNNGDEDWFKITVSQATADAETGVFVQTRPTTLGGDLTDTVIEVFEPDCVTSYGFIDTGNHETLFSDAFRDAGDYYIRISPYALGTGTFSYDLEVDTTPSTWPPRMPTVTDTELEPNNAFGMGTPVTGDAIVGYGEIFPAGDIDFWAVTPATTGTLVATTYSGNMFFCEDSSLDTYIEILDTDGSTVLAANEDVDAGNSNFCSAASASVTANTTYYVTVEDCQDAGVCFPGTSEFDYRLELVTTP